ncbi:uncharacterized protein AB675_6256 [Cyphellophora attinorum]|uniref:DUF7704 domain-containing protein n=1 Tax=Cyphellophora attinorum TaxID=1664694 RepID=A0A0N1H973_9EURO|nr:uncharacterized protein AB675_6256 [Phialophora attinorum]KPI43964.1 hypothetical protein AB675_6256 [Phialophora attinorum]
MAIPAYYKIFFLWIEPVVTLFGAVAAAFFGHDYLVMTHAETTPSKILGLPIATNIALRQLANLYLAFALNEFFVLRATNDLKVWKSVLAILLVADFGHLLANSQLGLGQYYDVMSWNAMQYGSFLFVYIGAAMRSCFLAGVGFGTKKGRRGAPRSVSKQIQAPTTVEDEFAAVATPSPKEMNKTPAQSTRRRKNRSVSGA